VKRILEAIYEQDFLRCSYGYRPNVGPLDAADKLTVKLQFGKYNYVVEADNKGFFDNIDHEKLLEMLAERIDDKATLWLIEKWLKAGVLETDGSVVHPITGTPQGGIISPLLANVYLHQVLDKWIQEEVLPRMNGEACLIRFADDFVCAFEKEEDAQRFYAVLGKRLGKYGLELSAEKTRIVPFSANNRSGEVSFDFLGFEYRWGKDRKGRPHVKRRTARKRLRKSLLKFKEWCRENRHLRLGETIRRVNAKFRGYYNYYGVPGNYESLHEFYYQAVQHLYKYLNRCSQRERFNWEGFKQVIEFFGIEKPRIVQKSPKARMATSQA
jgi:group II intron reverse transcriptase/maturase